MKNPLKKQLIHARKIAIVALILTTPLYGCKKNGIIESNTVEKTSKIKLNSIQNDMKAYLAIGLGVPADSILFDGSTNEFYVPNTDFRESLLNVTNFYDSANEYKSNQSF